MQPVEVRVEADRLEPDQHLETEVRVHQRTWDRVDRISVVDGFSVVGDVAVVADGGEGLIEVLGVQEGNREDMDPPGRSTR